MTKFLTSISGNQADRYLHILGITRKAPDYAYLCELVMAHLCSVPFENISKLYYLQTAQLQTLPDLDLYLDGTKRFHFGGTCYPNNYYFNLLLKFLGFDAILCGADMNQPDVHIVSIVKAEGLRYLVDVGYAAPFFGPMPIDARENYIQSWGHDKYLIQPADQDGNISLEFFRNDNYLHGYKVKPRPRVITDFESAIAASLAETATFRRALLLTRFKPGWSLRIHNLNIIESDQSGEKQSLISGRELLPATIEKYFGIPQTITQEAMKALLGLENPWN